MFCNGQLSPDLNPIKNLWPELKRGVSQGYQDSENFCVEERLKITSEMLSKRTNYRKRLMAANFARGANNCGACFWRKYIFIWTLVEFTESFIKQSTLRMLENKAYVINEYFLVYSTFCEDLSGGPIFVEPTVCKPGSLFILLVLIWDCVPHVHILTLSTIC